MPTPAEIEKEEKMAKMGDKSSADAVLGLIIPRLPFMPIIGGIQRAFPELSTWYQGYHQAMEQWREQTNTVLSRAATEDKTSVKSKTDEMQKQIDALNAVIFP